MSALPLVRHQPNANKNSARKKKEQRRGPPSCVVGSAFGSPLSYFAKGPDAVIRNIDAFGTSRRANRSALPNTSVFILGRSGRLPASLLRR